MVISTARTLIARSLMVWMKTAGSFLQEPAGIPCGWRMRSRTFIARSMAIVRKNVYWRRREVNKKMILSYCNQLSGDGKRKRVNACITTDHSASSYGQPVIVLEDGEALDLTSWVFCKYQVVSASEKEREMLARMGF